MHSKTQSKHGAAVFATWIIERGLTPTQLTKSDMVAYRLYLADHYKESTASNMLSVARRILEELVDCKQIERNPVTNVKGFKGKDETPHVALTRDEAQALLDAFDTRTLAGLRDYMLILFLLRTGIRRMEAVALTRRDLQMEQGHHVARIHHSKGNKQHTLKVPMEVWREIDSIKERKRVHAEDLHYQVAMLERKRERGLDEEAYQAKRQRLVEQHTTSEADSLKSPILLDKIKSCSDNKILLIYFMHMKAKVVCKTIFWNTTLQYTLSSYVPV